MKNPPDFVLYVVMIKPRGWRKFRPFHSYERKGIAHKVADDFRRLYGKDRAYVQLYGPIS